MWKRGSNVLSRCFSIVRRIISRLIPSKDYYERDSLRTRMLKQYLRDTFTCTVNPANKNIYDFTKKKMVYHRDFPHLGYVCPKCGWWDNFSRHYLINGNSVCERCALLVVEFYSEEKILRGLKPRTRRRYLQDIKKGNEYGDKL
jgi:hypothetical protein